MNVTCPCGITLVREARLTLCRECGSPGCRSCSVQIDAETYCRWCAAAPAPTP
jgi:hypothetical protein